MLDLSEIPFFSTLSPESISAIEAIATAKDYAQGSVIVRAGEVGKYFQAIADGAVWVQANDAHSLKNRGILLGPGQVFGEMSLFSGAPISNTLVATKDTTVYRIKGPDFVNLLEHEPSLHSNVTRILIERLRKQTRSESGSPSLILLSHHHRTEKAQVLADAIVKAVLHYAGGSEIYNTTPSSSKELRSASLASRLLRWRESAPGGQFLVLQIHPYDLGQLQDVMEPKDVLLQISDISEEDDVSELARIDSGIADVARVFIGIPPEGQSTPWAYHVSETELDAASKHEGTWSPESFSTISRIGRYLTHKEIGIAMSSGAARGFAHLGVLDELEKAGIPIDVMTGSSMGGIVALTVARKGTVSDAIIQMHQQLGSNKKIRDATLFPRGSLFAGSKVAAAADATFGNCTFADLNLPVSVVSADIAAGERVIIDRGQVAPAVLATSSIPGFFPPIKQENRFLVDGGVVSWVPVDVLDHRRCGVRIAINVLPLSHDSETEILSVFRRLGERLRRPLGLKAVLSASWELLGSWGSLRETEKAEIVITPKTPARAGYDFDRFDELVECGRLNAAERIDAIKDLVDQVLQS